MSIGYEDWIWKLRDAHPGWGVVSIERPASDGEWQATTWLLYSVGHRLPNLLNDFLDAGDAGPILDIIEGVALSTWERNLLEWALYFYTALEDHRPSFPWGADQENFNIWLTAACLRKTAPPTLDPSRPAAMD